MEDAVTSYQPKGSVQTITLDDPNALTKLTQLCDAVNKLLDDVARLSEVTFADGG